MEGFHIGNRYLIEIDMVKEKFEEEGHQPRHITRVVESFEGVKVISITGRPCPVCNPKSKGGCRCGRGSFEETSQEQTEEDC